MKKNTPSSSKFRIIAFNPNSIGKNPKRSKVFQVLKKKRANIILLSDTRIGKDIEPLVKAEWGGRVNFASFTSQARGVALFFTKDLAIEIMENSIYNDPSGNFTVLNFRYESFVITLSCVYGPNQDHPDFYKDVVFPRTEKCSETSDFIVMGGDWNIALDQSLDTFGYTSVNNQNAKNTLKDNIENLGLLDVFRENHPNKKRYSWRQFGGTKRARLDYFLISNTLLPFVENSDILPGVASDHSIPTLDIDFSKFKRGKGFFKFNNSLIKDPDYVKLINDTIRDVSALYAEDVYDSNFLKNATPEEQQNLVFTINPQLFLETMLLEIRGKTIGYCAWKKKSKNAAQSLALHRLEEAEIASDRQPGSSDLKEQLDLARDEVDKFSKQEAEAAECRARLRWKVEGEKPSKFFCKLEKYNAMQKYIPQLKVKDREGFDHLINEQENIDKELYSYYQHLYKSQESQLKTLTIDSFINQSNLSHPKLSQLEAQNLEGLLTLKEATDYMKSCRADASPGSSGFSGAFYKMFWRYLKHFIVNSLNFAYSTGSLSVTQKLGVIILLPKPDKDKKILSNWRPISLLNHVYKILSGALAERIKPVLSKIIHGDQKGFVSGRYIGECIRNTYDIVEYAKNNNRSGLLLLIDFEKAFDSISHSFIIKCLHFFGFGFSFIKWINVLLNDISSCINHCGNISDRFKIGRSCRQGDPISPYLFIICVEILALKIRNDNKVRGFKLGNFVQKLDFYADDLTAYLDGSESSLRQILQILEEFKGISGLKINLSKCKAVWIGKNRLSNFILCQELKLIWTKEFRLLGIDFDADLAKMDTNFKSKLKEIKNLYSNWLYRNLSPLGKITVIKSLALSKLSNVVLTCPHMSPEVLKELEQLSFSFLWNNKPDRVKRCDITLPYDKGGLNMPDIGQFWNSLKLSWSRRLMTSEGAWQKILQLNLLAINYDMTDIWYGGPTLVEKIGGKVSNKFWSETIQIFAKVMREIPFSYPHFFYNLNIFDNELFAVNNCQLNKNNFPALWSRKIVQVGEFFNMNLNTPSLLTREEFNSKFRLNIDFLTFHRITASISQGNKNLNNKTYHPDLTDTGSPRIPILHKLSCIQVKGCGIFYQTLRAKEIFQRSTLKSENKWHNELATTFSVQFWDNIWKLLRNPHVSNRMKWVQLQINRFLLPTNSSVNKYNPTQNPICSFCPNGNHLERISTLFWTCSVVKGFWETVENILQLHSLGFKITKKEAIFGDNNTRADSVENTVLLLSREFIWIQKFTSKKLDDTIFINFMKDQLKQIVHIAFIKNKSTDILKCWGPILQFFDVDHSDFPFIDNMS